jgi:hypothetical protein
VERRDLSSIEPHLQRVNQSSSWESGSLAIFNTIPLEDEIKELYNIYTGRPAATPAPSDSSTDSLFGYDEDG